MILENPHSIFGYPEAMNFGFRILLKKEIFGIHRLTLLSMNYGYKDGMNSSGYLRIRNNA